MSESQVKYATPKAPSLDDQIMAELSGGAAPVDFAAIDNERSAREKERIKGLMKNNEELASQVKNINRAVGAIDAVAGVHTAVRGIVRNTYNGLVGVVNSVEDYAASKGLGTGDLIDDSNKWQDAAGHKEEQELGQPGKLAHTLTKVAVPVALGFATGGATLAGAATGVGLDGMYNFLAENPEDDNLADVLKGTLVDEVPAVHEALSYVRHKPDDSEMDMRIKNGVVGLGFSAAVAGLVGIATNLSRFRAGKKALNSPEIIQGVEKENAVLKNMVDNPPMAPVVDNTVGSVENTSMPIGHQVDMSKPPMRTPQPIDGETAQDVADMKQAFDGYDPNAKVLQDAAPVVGSADEAAKLTKLEEAQYKSPDTPEQAAEFEKQAEILKLDAPMVHVNEAGQESFQLNNTFGLDFLYKVSKILPDGVLRVPMADIVRGKAAAEVVSKPGALEDIIKRFSSEPNMILNDVETAVVQHAIGQTETMWSKALNEYNPRTATPDQRLAFERMRQGYFHMSDILQGNASNQGAALRAEQQIASVFGTTQKNGLALMGAQGRAKLSKALIQKFNLEGNHEAIVDGLKIINNLPDSQFKRNAYGEISRLSKFERMDNAITKVALNGMTMLSTKGAAIANSIMTGKIVADKYVQALNPLSKVTFNEANNLAHGVFSSMADALQVGWSAAKESATGNSNVARLDLVAGAAKLTSQKDKAIASGLVSWSERGVRAVEQAGEVLSLGGAPTHALVGVDHAFTHVLTQGLLRSEAYKAADAAGKLSHEIPDFVENFIKNPPTEIADQIDNMAKEAVLSNDVPGKIGAWLEKFQDLVSPVPTARVVFPFMRTTANGMIQFVENSPLAMATPKFASAVKAVASSSDPAVRAAADAHLTKIFTGTMAISGLMYLANTGKISGGFGENKDLNKNLQGKDYPPNTAIKIGETWVPAANLGYISSLINIASFVNRVSPYLDDGEYEQVANGFMAAAAENLVPDNLTDNVGGLVAAVNRDPRAATWVSELATRYTPFGSGLRALKNTVDPIKRDTALDGFFDALQAKYMSRIPWLSKDLPADRNYFGETVTVPPGLTSTMISMFSPSDDDETNFKNAGLQIKRTMDTLTMYHELHKDDPIPPTQVDFRPPGDLVPLVRTSAGQSVNTGLTYKLQPFEKSAFERIAGGVNYDGSPLLNPDGSKIIPLKQFYYNVLKDYDLLDKLPTQIDPKKYELALSKIKEYETGLRNKAKVLILKVPGVADNMNQQALKAWDFKQQQGIQ